MNQEANAVKNLCFRNQQTHLNKVLQVGCVRALKGVRTSTFQRLRTTSAASIFEKDSVGEDPFSIPLPGKCEVLLFLRY